MESGFRYDDIICARNRTSLLKTIIYLERKNTRFLSRYLLACRRGARTCPVVLCPIIRVVLFLFLFFFLEPFYLDFLLKKPISAFAVPK